MKISWIFKKFIIVIKKNVPPKNSFLYKATHTPLASLHIIHHHHHHHHHNISLSLSLFRPAMAVSSTPWALVALFLMASSTVMAIPPRKAIDVPFGRNYVPTWAFDHQKQLNGGSELQLILDKYTGTFTTARYFG